MEEKDKSLFKYNGKTYKLIKQPKEGKSCKEFCSLYNYGCEKLCVKAYNELDNPDFGLIEAVFVEVDEAVNKETNMKENEIDYKALYEEEHKKYEDAVERVKGITSNMTTLQSIREHIFPELVESEDEKIRRKLLNWFKDCKWDTIDNGTLKRDDIIAWLEERIQPQQECSEDEKVRKSIIKFLQVGGYMSPEDKDKAFAWLEKQKTTEEALRYLKENHSPSEMSDFQAAMNIAVAKAYNKGYTDGLEKQGEVKRSDYPYVPGWRENRPDNKPKIKHSILMLTIHGVAEGEWLGEEWCQYRWSCKIKDTEVLYWLYLSDLETLEKENVKQGEQTTDKIIEKARTEKQRILLTETNGDAHIDWDCRSLQDVKSLLKYGLEYIDAQLEKQSENNMGISEATKKKLEDNLNKALEKETPGSWNKFLDKQDEQKPADKVEQKSAAYFYCKCVGTTLKCGDCVRNHLNSKYKIEDIKTWMTPTSCSTKQCSDYISVKWSEEDEVMLGNALWACKEKYRSIETYNWLKSLKERVQLV